MMVSYSYYEYDPKGLCLKIRSNREVQSEAYSTKIENSSAEVLINRAGNKEVWVEGDIDPKTGSFLKDNPVKTTTYKFSRYSIHSTIVAGTDFSEINTEYNEKGFIVAREALATTRIIATFSYDNMGLLVKMEMILQDEEEGEKGPFFMEYKYPELDEMNNWTKRIGFNRGNNTYTVEDRNITYW